MPARTPWSRAPPTGCSSAPRPRCWPTPASTTLIVTDSVPPFRLPAAAPVRRKLRLVSAVPLFAEAIRDCHDSWAR